MPGFLVSLDIFVQASRMESRSYSLSEAMAAGLPVISNNAPGNDELVENEKSGLIVPVDDPGSLADAVQRLINDKNLAESLGKEAFKYVEDELDSDKILNEFESFLNKLIDRQGKRRT